MVLFFLFPAVCLASNCPPTRMPPHGACVAPAVVDDLSRKSSARVWLFLKDKALDATGLQRELSRLENDYNSRARARRHLRRTSPGLFDERDLPVCAGHVEAIKATGARVRQRSRWLNAVSAEVNASQLAVLAALPFVDRIEPVRGLTSAGVIPAHCAPVAPARLRDFYGYAGEQLRQTGIAPLQESGINGSGVVIGILDTGFLRTHAALNQPGRAVNVVAEYDFVSDDGGTAPQEGDFPDQFVHGTLILGTIASYLPDSLIGGAYGASFVLAKTEDISQEVPAEEDDYVAGLEFIEANGADMSTSSLGYIDWYAQANLDGHTAVTTIAVNTATENGLVCVTAAGNSGHDQDAATSHLLAPADALQVVACGAVDVNGVIADFSSDGPSADGRIKPELLARGVDTYTIWPYDDSNLATASGTSLSTPLVASATALVLQAHPQWSVAQIRAALLQTGGDFVSSGAFDPLFVRGYGIVNAYAAAQLALCDGDLDGDFAVTLSDLVILLANYGRGGAVLYRDGDLDLNGTIDLSDLASLLASYGATCP